MPLLAVGNHARLQLLLFQLGKVVGCDRAILELCGATHPGVAPRVQVQAIRKLSCSEGCRSIIRSQVQQCACGVRSIGVARESLPVRLVRRCGVPCVPSMKLCDLHSSPANGAQANHECANTRKVQCAGMMRHAPPNLNGPRIVCLRQAHAVL